LGCGVVTAHGIMYGGGTLEAFEMSIAFIIRRYAGTNVHVFNLLLGLHHAMNGSI